ncbi:dihydrodipicolinate synthase family protein [Thalassotalea euphylliae]|uniref:dihydrodipicolinate synthase family protein n=1 Tax=Thalassotalea euphylliae TaxID=1655234 RepID=UPI0036354573
MFTGLSAFPLTPFKDEHIDFTAFEKLISNLVDAKVDSIGALGSTGLYPYLKTEEIKSVAQKTVEFAAGTPVMAGIGALRTIDVLKNAQAVQEAGVNAVLLAPMSYHRMQEDEVFELYQQVTANLSVPLCVYENPGTTNFTFSDELYRDVTRLPHVAAIKIPGMPFATEQGHQRLTELRKIVPEHVAIGVSGDKFGAKGMAAGCDLWLSVLGGLFPHTVKAFIEKAATLQQCLPEQAQNQYETLWGLFVKYKGGLRVMATAANILGFVEGNGLPAPLKPMNKEDRDILATLITQLDLK